MDGRFSGEGKARKRTRLRRMCSLCNESCRDPEEQMKHYSSTVHKHMKRIKQKQYSYTKNLRTLEEKIKVSEEHEEPLIGLEYIYQYAADKRGVIPYVCMLCDRVYKLDTIFFHIVGIKHRSMYLGKNFPALGIDLHYKARTTADYIKLLNASEVIEKCHGRKKINVSNTLFNPKKNGGMTYDSDSGREGLSSSEDEKDNPSSTKPERETIRRGAGDNNSRSVNHRGDLPFAQDRKGGPPLPNIDRGGPAFPFDGRRGPEVQDGRRDMKRPLRDHDVSGFQHGHSDRNYREDNDRLPMELSYQHRGSDSRKVPGRTDFPGDHNPSSQVHRDETAFQYDDRQGVTLQDGPRHANSQVRNNDRDFAFQHDQSTRSLGIPHDLDMPPMGSLLQQVDLDGIKGQNNLQSQMHSGGTAFQYDDRRGGLRHTGNHDQRTKPLGNSHGDLDMPSMGRLHQQVDRDDLKSQNRTQSHPSGFFDNRDPQSQMNPIGMGFPSNDRQGTVLTGGPRHTESQVRNNDRDLAFRHDQSTRSQDFVIPSVGTLHQQVDRDGIRGPSRTQNHPPNFPGEQDLSFQMKRDDVAFQYDYRNDDRDFAFRGDQGAGLLGSAHGDVDMSSMGSLHQQAGADDLKSRNRTLNHPPGFLGDRDFQSHMQQGGMEFQYDERKGPMREGLRENNNDFASQHEQRTRLPGGPHGDRDLPSLGPLHQQVDRDDFKSKGIHPPGFPGDHDLSTRMHRDGTEFQFDSRHGSMLQSGPRQNDNHVTSESRAFAFQHDQSARLLGNVHGDLDMPSMGPSHQQVDRFDMNVQNRPHIHSPGFSGDRDFSSRMHRDGIAFQYDDGQEPTLQGGPRRTDEQVRNIDRSYRHDQRRLSLGNTHSDLGTPSMRPSHQQVDYDDIQRFPGDRQSDRLLPNVHGDLDVPSMESFYPQGGRPTFEERSGAENCHPGLSGDRSLHSEKHRGGMVHDGRIGVDGIRFQMHGDFISFRELKAAHKAGLSIEHSGMDKQGANQDSDMEVRSMDLSDNDPDEFLCNAELFEFVRTFKIQSYEDEQFALRVRDFFTNGSIRYKKHKEESLRRRIAEEKEKLEEEKKAFLEIQKSKEYPKKKHQQPLTIAPNKNQAPGLAPSSSSKALFPMPPSSNTGLANKPIPLMSLVIGRSTGAESNLQPSPSHPGQKGSMAESRPPTKPSMNPPPARKSRWAPESVQTPLDVRPGERSNQPSERGDFFPSRGLSEGTRNLPPRFTTHTGSMKY